MIYIVLCPIREYFTDIGMSSMAMKGSKIYGFALRLRLISREESLSPTLRHTMDISLHGMPCLVSLSTSQGHWGPSLTQILTGILKLWIKLIIWRKTVLLFSLCRYLHHIILYVHLYCTSSFSSVYTHVFFAWYLQCMSGDFVVFVYVIRRIALSIMVIFVFFSSKIFLHSSIINV